MVLVSVLRSYLEYMRILGGYLRIFYPQVLQELGDKKFANDPNTKKEQESHHSCLNNLINAPESLTQSLFLYVIKLNFYFHRKEFRRIKGSINKSILFTIDKPWIS